MNDILKNANDVNLAFSKGVVQFHTLHFFQNDPEEYAMLVL